MYNCAVFSYKCASNFFLQEYMEIKQKHKSIEKVSQSKLFCNVCNVSFRTNQGFNGHKKMYQVSKSEECKNCGEQFKDKKDSSNYISEHHLSSLSSNNECENCKELDICEGRLDCYIARGNTKKSKTILNIDLGLLRRTDCTPTECLVDKDKE